MEDFVGLIKAIPVAFLALTPVINPIGTAIILLSMTPGADGKIRQELARTITTYSIIFLTVIVLVGRYVLEFFGISIPVVQLTGGAVLVAMGWNLLNQRDSTEVAKQTSQAPVDPQTYSSMAFYPFTFPVTIGPGGVAVALTLSAHTSGGGASIVETGVHQAGTVLGIFASGMTVYFAIANSSRVTQRLGPSGTSAMMRLIAFIVMCIGTQISWSGLSALRP